MKLKEWIKSKKHKAKQLNNIDSNSIDNLKIDSSVIAKSKKSHGRGKAIAFTKADFRTAFIGFVLAFSLFTVLIGIVYVDSEVSITAFAEKQRSYFPCINQDGNIEFKIVGNKFVIKVPFK